MVKHLWEIFRDSYDNGLELQVRGSVELLRILAEEDKSVVGQKIQLVQQVIRKEMESPLCDWVLVRQVALILKAEGFQDDD